ncbi:phage tail family protein [Lactococcus lactis]|uniref:distal tail protein Dit n=1 Tax=Lactococcus lactis TaxID=1358 RepID=UPI002418B4FF|nr:distal tail protein Dit [Lactococcus lactis]MDG4966254.1 phage tail family protein [Lactococcus lactis]
MYNFTDTKEKGSVLLPEEAINVDGFFLDREITGFSTLTIDGRESLGVSMDDYVIPRSNGIKIRNKALKERVLVVHYAINTKDTEEFYSSMKKLKKHLYKEKSLKIFFNDEPNLYYEGHLRAINPPENNYIKSTGSFEIICPMPYKYHFNTKKSITNKAKANIDSNMPIKVRMLKIDNLTSSGTSMTIQIGTYQMKFTSLPSTIGKNLVIDFERLAVSLGGQVITSNLDILSDFGNIRISDEDVVYCSLLNNTSKIILDVEEYDL